VINDWYSDPDNRNLLTIGLALSIIAAIAFLWFIAVIRRRVGTREDQFFATVFLGSGILLTGIALIGAAVLASPTLIDHSDANPPDPDIISAITSVGHTLLYIVLVRIQAVFVISTSTLAMRTQAFSRYLSYFGYLIAVVMFVMPIATEPVGLAFPLWVGILSLALITRLADIKTNLPT
jgi:multidrug transporter EmrE-like cation transporter